MKRMIVILIFLSVIPLVNLLTPGIMQAHDAPDHVARIANFYQSLSEGVWIPRWAANLNWGYGHPILMFLYPLPSYVGSVFHAFGLTLAGSVKLVFAVSYTASILAFFLWARRQWNPVAGAVGAVLYGFAPYRFVDLYVRGAIGEHVAFVFPPLIFLGLLGIARNTGSWAGVLLALAMAGLLLSHNAISLMMLPVILLYFIYLYIYETKNRRNFFILAAWNCLLGFMLSAFFWIPAFFEGKYTLRDIVTRGEFANRFVPLGDFFHSPWNYGGSATLSKEIGIPQLVAIIGLVITGLLTRSAKTKALSFGIISLLVIALMLMTQVSRIVWDTVGILQKFQFPWRIMTVVVFLSAASGSLGIAHVKKRQVLIASLFVGLALITTMHMWKAKGYLVYPESRYTGIYPGTTDTGESSPIWSVRFMEREPAARVQVISGKALVLEPARTTTGREYFIQADERSRILENTLYFPGWRVLVDGSQVPVEFQDPEFRGLMTFWVDKGAHRVKIVFGDTKVRRFSNLISLAGLLMLGSLSTMKIWMAKRRSR